MPQRRTEVVEKVDASLMMPDIYENWLNKQQSGHAKARSGFIGDQDIRLGEQEAQERQGRPQQYLIGRLTSVETRTPDRRSVPPVRISIVLRLPMMLYTASTPTSYDRINFQGLN
jgi:hypothetical protein